MRPLKTRPQLDLGGYQIAYDTNQYAIDVHGNWESMSFFVCGGEAQCKIRNWWSDHAALLLHCCWQITLAAGFIERPVGGRGRGLLW